MKKSKIIFIVFIALALLLSSLSCISASTASTDSPSLTSPTDTAIFPPTASTSSTPTRAPQQTGTSGGTFPNPNWTPPTLSSSPLPADLSDIVDGVLPSVVSINVQTTSTNFFNQPTTVAAAGSGWIIDPDGLIVTNNHVVEGAQDISVSLNDGRVFPSQQVALDPASDLAVIKINASDLPAVTLGDSSKLKRGMMVIAIGNALGEGISVTAGWVSRLGVSLTVPSSSGSSAETLFDLIETSAPINPGNSGGPLVDMLGEVVGITNAKLVASGVENVGYAISTKTAIPIVEQIIRSGRVTRPYLGVSLQDVTPDIASIYGLAVDYGALITQVAPNSPASNAGLEAGDVIVSINGQDVNAAADAVQIVRSGQVGQQLTITYYRGNSQATVQVTTTQNPLS